MEHKGATLNEGHLQTQCMEEMLAENLMNDH